MQFMKPVGLQVQQTEPLSQSQYFEMFSTAIKVHVFMNGNKDLIGLSTTSGLKPVGNLVDENRPHLAARYVIIDQTPTGFKPLV